jgi:hydroxyacylglutathione hydrolase
MIGRLMPRLAVHTLSLGVIGTNCYVAHADGSTRAFVVDPGDQADQVLELAQREGLTIEDILVTHCHWDHIGAIAPVAEATGAKTWMSELESPIVEERINTFVPQGVGPFRTWPIDNKLAGDERFEAAGVEVQAIHLPGHSPGTTGFFVDGERAEDGSWHSPPVLFVGDLIFQDSVGRTDLPGSDPSELVRSVRLLLDTLDDETILLSGHGPATTLGRERRANPFVAPIAAR